MPIDRLKISIRPKNIAIISIRFCDDILALLSSPLLLPLTGWRQPVKTETVRSGCRQLGWLGEEGGGKGAGVAEEKPHRGGVGVQRGEEGRGSMKLW